MCIHIHIRALLPTSQHTPTSTSSSVTEIQVCTSVKNVPCIWQFICKASSNTLCTLFVQTNSSTCNYETPQRRSGQLDNTARPHFSLGLRNYHWSTSSRKQHYMITGSQYSFWSTHIVLFSDTAAISE